MAFFNKLNPFGAPGLRTLGKAAPIKKLGMSPKPAATPGIGPSQGGAAQDMATNFMGKMGMKQPNKLLQNVSPDQWNQVNQRIGQGGEWNAPGGGIMAGKGGGWNSPTQWGGGGFRDQIRYPEQQMGGMQNRLRELMGGNTGFNGSLGSTNYPPPPQSMGGQAAPTPDTQEGVIPEPLPPGQAMGQLQPQQRPMGPSPDMMGGMFGGMNRRFGGGMNRSNVMY